MVESGQQGQDRRVRMEELGQQGQAITRTIQQGKDGRARTLELGQKGQGDRDRTVGLGQQGQDGKNMKVWSGRQGQDSRMRTFGIGQTDWAMAQDSSTGRQERDLTERKTKKDRKRKQINDRRFLVYSRFVFVYNHEMYGQLTKKDKYCNFGSGKLKNRSQLIVLLSIHLAASINLKKFSSYQHITELVYLTATLISVILFNFEYICGY